MFDLERAAGVGESEHRSGDAVFSWPVGAILYAGGLLRHGAHGRLIFFFAFSFPLGPAVRSVSAFSKTHIFPSSARLDSHWSPIFSTYKQTTDTVTRPGTLTLCVARALAKQAGEGPDEPLAPLIREEETAGEGLPCHNVGKCDDGLPKQAGVSMQNMDAGSASLFFLY